MIKRWLFYNSSPVEWLLRILFTLNLFLAGWNYGTEDYYPMVPLMLTLIGLWLYFFRLKILALPLLILALWINYDHLGMQPSSNTVRIAHDPKSYTRSLKARV
jgi:hypothetical protein